MLKSGACRCHICGQLGHPAEAGLCPYIACSFCRQFGHWNHMCPNIEKVSRTLCFKCQRYGHRTEVFSINTLNSRKLYRDLKKIYFFKVNFLVMLIFLRSNNKEKNKTTLLSFFSIMINKNNFLKRLASLF